MSDATDNNAISVESKVDEELVDEEEHYFSDDEFDKTDRVLAMKRFMHLRSNTLMEIFADMYVGGGMHEPSFEHLPESEQADAMKQLYTSTDWVDVAGRVTAEEPPTISAADVTQPLSLVITNMWAAFTEAFKDTDLDHGLEVTREEISEDADFKKEFAGWCVTILKDISESA